MAILDWMKELPLAAIYKERLADSEKQIRALELKVIQLAEEKAVLQARLEECEHQRRALDEQIVKVNHGNPDGYVCDHCGSPRLRRTGNRPDPTFGGLGVKQAVFTCEACGLESAFTPR
jgi:hypothetical protein